MITRITRAAWTRPYIKDEQKQQRETMTMKINWKFLAHLENTETLKNILQGSNIDNPG